MNRWGFTPFGGLTTGCGMVGKCCGFSQQCEGNQHSHKYSAVLGEIWPVRPPRSGMPSHFLVFNKGGDTHKPPLKTIFQMAQGSSSTPPGAMGAFGRYAGRQDFKVIPNMWGFFS